LLVRLKSREQRDIVLSRGYKCKDFKIGQNTRQVGISEDKSVTEREETKNLIKIMMERRAGGEEDLQIRGGKIVVIKKRGDRMENQQ